MHKYAKMLHKKPETVDIQEAKKKRCSKCDYMNNNIPINTKKPNCRGKNNLVNCEVFIRTLTLKNRIEYLLGDIGPMFICGKGGCDVETYQEEE